MLDLEPLAAPAQERLVAAAAARAGGAARDLPVQRLRQAASGNPLALELLTSEWVAHGSSSLLADLEALNTRPAANIGIPRAIGAVFERQIRRLDGPTRAALDLAAVLGRRLADLAVYDVVGLAPAAAGETLSRLREERFLREIHGGLEFRNELIRAQAYYAVAGPARQHLHRRVAQLLAERPPEEHQALHLEIAWHFLRGGDAAHALPYALDGSEAALNVGAPYEAEQILATLLREGVGTPELRRRVNLLLCRALLDQSKADAAVPALDEVLADPGLAPRELAEAARMRAAAEYLLNRETGEQYCQAASTALAAARRLSDVQLTAQALFECARAGAEFGDEGRVGTALSELLGLLEEPGGADNPVVLHGLGFCYFFFFEVRLAAQYLERAIEVLKRSSDSVTLNYAYNGYGLSKQYLCEFDAAKTAYLEGLSLATRIGDDSRASIIASNLSGLRCTEGDYRGSIECGQRSIEAASRSSSQPHLLGAYTNLAEAYLLTGDIENGLRCIEAARAQAERERSWRARVGFLADSANLALLIGNTGHALDTIARMETAIWGRERAAPGLGLVERLRIFRAGHIGDPALACAMAREARERFRHRNLMFYLDALSAQAWAEIRAYGRITAETGSELTMLDIAELAGKKAALLRQGFLS
jgi:tetratricopeptide (TPR) repeat protein